MADHVVGLLLLREADVVRVCGLVAAAQALDVVRAERVSACRRAGARLSADVREADVGAAYASWIEITWDAAPQTVEWGCTCPLGGHHARQSRPSLSTGSALACVHVAALMTAWLRNPAQFLEPPNQRIAREPPTPIVRRPVVRTGPPARPGSASAVERHVEVRSLRDHLHQLARRDLDDASRRVLGAAAAACSDEASQRAALHDTLTNPVLLAALCATLDDVALVLLRGALYHGGTLTDADLTGIGDRAGLTHAAQVVARHELRVRCLLFPVGDADSAIGWSVPVETIPHLDVTVSTPARALPGLPARRTSAATNSGQAATSADRALRSLCLALTLMTPTRAQLRPTNRQAPRPAERPARGETLQASPDTASPAALEAWARAAHVDLSTAQTAYRVMRAALTGAGESHPALSLAHLPAEEWAGALRAAISEWLDAHNYDELADLNESAFGVCVRCDPRHPAFSSGTLRDENVAARVAVVRLLTQVPRGVWHGLDDFATDLWVLDPTFLRARQRTFETPAWWIENRTAGRLLGLDSRDEWLHAEGAYVRVLLAGTLRCLGLVEVRDGANGTAAFRTTPWTAYLLGVAQEPPSSATALARGWGVALRPEAGPTLSVQPLALAPHGCGPLEGWAFVSGGRAGRLLWRLSPDRFCRHFDASRTTAELLAWLGAHDSREGTRAAQHVAALFERWQQRYGTSSVERATVVEARDEVVLREALAALPDLATEIRVVAPGMASLPHRHAHRVEQVLSARGYLV